MKTYIINSRVYSDYLVANDTTHMQEITGRQELYEKSGKTLTKKQAEREIVADFIADELLTNEESIRELAQTNRGLFVKVKEFLNKIIANLKKFATGSDNITKAQKDLIQIRNLYNKAFKDVKKSGKYSTETKYSKKLGGYNPEINVTTDNILKEYGIKNINAKYEVINKIANKLERNYLSTDKISKPITNIDTGLKIEIRKSGIRENFGNDKYYLNLSTDLKLAKIASMSELAKMIKYGEVRSEDASNYHNPKSKVRFSYLQSSINVDGVNYDVTIDIKKLPNNDNIFYIHDLKIKKQETNSFHRTANGLKVNLPLANNNISQKNDTVNTNIRKNFDNDTKFSIAKPIEETKDLIAVHNLSKQNLTDCLELGGIPMPSIAITKDNIGHADFGDISLVFGKDTIDPQQNRNNKVYSNDAYTPTFPRVEYKFNEAQLKKAADYFNVSPAYLKSNMSDKNIEAGAEDLFSVNEIKKRYLQDKNIRLNDRDEYEYFNVPKHRQELKSYIRDIISPIYEKRGIYNGEGPFTENGDFKGFEATHYEYTLDNILRAINQGDQTGTGFTNGVGSLRGAVSNTYNSIEDLHENESRLFDISDNEYSEMMKLYQNRLGEIIGSMLKESDTNLLRYDNAGSVIIESVRNGLSIDSIEQVLSEYKSAYNITEQTAKDIKALAEDLLKMPTKYFEAKPQRVVNFSEVKTVLIPEGSSSELINGLKEAGVGEVLTYTDKEDRLDKLNALDDDVKFSISDENEKWKPIKPSEKTQKVLDRLAENKSVTLDLIAELPEIAEGYARRGHINPTININTEEREQLRTDIQNEVESLGSAKLDKNGEWVYNGNIEQGHRVDIVIGLPAAGKSTVLANPLSETYNSRIVDSDIVKEKLPEYDNGYGADHVHKESKLINDKILDKATSKGENIVLPIIGSDYVKLVEKINKFRDGGYSVHLHLNELPMNKSLGRMLNRFLTDGRFIDPKTSYKYQNKPSAVFDRVINTKGDLLDGYSKYSNDVERGQDPVFIKGTENIQEAYKGRDKGTTEGNSGDVRESRRDGTSSNNEYDISTKDEEKYSVNSDAEAKVKELNEKYGTKKKGENPTRNIDVPEKTSDNKRVREFVKTVLESDVVTEDMLEGIGEELVKEAYSYEPLSNETELKIAEEWIDDNGKGVSAKHFEQWNELQKADRTPTAIDIAKGELLLRSAAKSGDKVHTMKLIADLAEMGTTAGQQVQAMRLLKKSTGIGQLYYAEKTVRRMNADYEAKYAKQKRKGKEIPHIEINEELAVELAQAKTETGILFLIFC